MAYTVVRKPKETVNGLWKGIKNLKWEDVRKLAFERFDNYAKGGDMARHQGGKDGVRIAMVVFASVKKLGSKAGDIVENAGEVTELARKVDFDEAVKKNLDEVIEAADGDKLIKDCAEDAALKAFVEESSTELKDVASSKSRKLSWEEVKARFKRGNDFNAKAKANGWYDYHEVTIEHPTLKYSDGKPKRFRLDSYNEGIDIVSRKATDLSVIQKSTFENYLKELVDKYPVGAKIVTPGSAPDIDGKLLQGNFKLEIPASNASFSSLAEYRQIASNFTHNGKQYNIEIVLKTE